MNFRDLRIFLTGAIAAGLLVILTEGWSFKEYPISFQIRLSSDLAGKYAGADSQDVVVDANDARALFVGDSITKSWPKASENRNAGIPGAGATLIGQRFASEIRGGSPNYVHILAGTNDVGGGRDAPSIAIIGSMVDEARRRNIPVIVGTIPPIDALLFPHLSPYVAQFNLSLVAEVKPKGAFIADYYKAMSNPDGSQNRSLFLDGIHPNDAGYAVMTKVLRETRREMYRTIYTPEQRKAWREKRKAGREAK